VSTFRFNRWLRKPYGNDWVCFGTLIAGALLLWATLHVFYAEYLPAFTQIYSEEPYASLKNSEFSPAGRAARMVHTTYVPMVGLAVLWYLIVLLTELRLAARRRKKEALTTQSRCTQCGDSVAADVALSGLDGACPNCGTTFTFPITAT